MKISYIIRHDINRNDGVTKKIRCQIDNWESLGHEVLVFAYVPNLGDSILPANQYVMNGAIKSRLFLDEKLLMDVTHFSPDMVYFRYDTWSSTLERILSKYPAIVELNTLDLSEFYALFKLEKNVKSFFRFIAYRFFRSLVLRKVAGIISVTNEIKNDPSNKKFGKLEISIPNGIDLSTYRTIKSIDENHERIGLFFIGTPGQPWHGVDIIKQFAMKMRNIDFHIVGIEGDSLSNIFYHGYLDVEKYTKVLKKCSICIGSLALFRINMTEACPLKVREYLAYGYPVILGYQDTSFINKDIKPDFMYVINATHDVSSEDVDALQQFIMKNKNKVVFPDQIEFLDTKYLEKERVAFFEKVLSENK